MAGMAQWIEWQPANWKVTGLIPGQGTCLGYRPGSQVPSWVREERQQIDVSLTQVVFLPVFLPPFPSL